MWRRARVRLCGIASTAIGWLALNGLLHAQWAISHWSATVLLHDFPSYGLISLATCAVALMFCDPWRTLEWRTSGLHGLALGAALGWLRFAVVECDLFERNDRLFCVYCGLLASIVVGRIGGAWAVYCAARSIQSAPVLLRVERLASLCDSLARGPASAPLVHRKSADGGELFPGRLALWFDRWNVVRCRIGLGPSRAYHLERALQFEIDRQTGRWRAALDQFARDLKAAKESGARGTANSTDAQDAALAGVARGAAGAAAEGNAQHGASAASVAGGELVKQGELAIELGVQTVRAFEFELALVGAARARGESLGASAPDWFRRWVVLWDMSCELREMLASQSAAPAPSARASGNLATRDEPNRRLVAAARSLVGPATQRWLTFDPPRNREAERLRERQLAELCAPRDGRSRVGGADRSIAVALFDLVRRRAGLVRRDTVAETASSDGEERVSRAAGAAMQVPAWERHIGVLVLAECLVREGLALWAPPLLDGAMGDAPAWLASSVSRLRAAAERRVLEHAHGLTETDLHWRRTLAGAEGVRADSPVMRAHSETDRADAVVFRDEGGPDQLAATLRGARLPASRRRTRGRALPRPGYDPGPGRWLLSTVCGTLLLAWLVVFPPPWGSWSPVKSLRFLFRPEHSHAAPIADAALDVGRNQLLLATDGNGLHSVDLRTYRVSTEDRASGSLASNHLGSVAVTARGEVAASTTADFGSFLSSGVDAKFRGRWRTLIPPVGCETPNGGQIVYTFRLPESSDGAEQLLVTRRGPLVYSHARRALRTVEPLGSNASTDRSILESLTAATLVPATGEVWLASDAAAGPRLVVLRFHDQRRKYSLTSVNPAFPDAEVVEQLVAFGPRIWARTRSGRLQEWNGANWRLLADGGRKLDLTRVRHALVGVGATPALWLVEEDEAGVVTGIRARLLPERHRLATSGDTWLLLDAQLLEQFQVAGSGDRALDAPYPVAWFDDRAGRHELLLAGKDSGVVRVRTEATGSGSATGGGDRALSIDRVDTAGESVLRLDSDGARLLMLLESNSSAGRRRRAVAVALQQLDRWSAVAPVLDSWAPGPGVADASIVAAASDESAVWIVCDSGRVVRYSKSLHGLTDPRGVELTLNDAPVTKLLSGDFSSTRLVALDQQGRVVGTKRPAAERGAASTELLHRFVGDAPPSTARVRRVATEPDGIELFMSDGKSDTAKSGAGAPADGAIGDGLVTPWTYRLQPRPGSWAGLTPSAPEGVQLHVDSLARLQSGSRVGPLLALGSQTLMWRSREGWRPVPDAGGGWSDLWSAEGATFVRGEAGLLQVTSPNADGAPPGLAAWWPRTPAYSVLPSALAGVNVGGRARLLSAHPHGLSEYDPAAQRWRRHALSTDFSSVKSWTLLGERDSRGLCRILWAAPTATPDLSGIRHVARIVGGAVDSLDLGQDVIQATATGERLAALLADRRLITLSGKGAAAELLPGETGMVGDARLTRMAVGQRLYALDDKGRLLQSDLRGRDWRLVPATARSQQLDFDLAADGSVIVAGADDVVRRLNQQGAAEELVRLARAEVERVGDRVALIGKTNHSLLQLDASGRQPVVAAGGLSSNKVGSPPHAILAAGAELYLAGEGGVAYRDPLKRSTQAVTGPEKVERFETFGAHRIARTSDGAVFSLTKSEAKNLGSATSVVAGPSGKLWLLPKEHSALRGVADGERLFDDPAESGAGASPTATSTASPSAGRPPEWPSAPTQLAPLDDRRVLLVDQLGRLAVYDSRRRSLQLVPGLAANEVVAELRRLGTRLIVTTVHGERPRDASGAARASGVYVVELSPLRAKLVEAADEAPLFTGGQFVWRRGPLVREMRAGGDAQTLATLPSPPMQAQENIIEALAAPDGVLWATDGKSARAFHWERGIERTAAGVAAIARVGGKLVGVARANEAWALVDLQANQPLTSKYSRVHVGADCITVWNEKDGVRTWQSVSGDRAGASSARFIPPGDLGTIRDTGYTSVDGRRVFMLDKTGAIVGYDTTRGVWNSVDSGSGWIDLGRRGQHVVARRERDGATQIQLFTVDGTPGPRIASPGAAWFDERGSMQLDEPSAGVAHVSYVEFAGKRSVLAEFRRTTAPFDRGRVWQAGERRIGLLSAKTATRLIVAHGKVVREADNIHNGEIDAPLVPRDLAYKTDHLMFVDRQRRLVEINLSTGSVGVRATDVVAAGRIGTQLWAVVSEGTGVAVKPLERPVAVPLPIQQLLKRARIESQFVKAGDELALRVKLKPLGDSPAPDRSLVLVERPQGLAVLQWGGARHPDAPPAGQPLEVVENAATGELALVQGWLLRTDGWFAHSKPVRFGGAGQVAAARQRLSGASTATSTTTTTPPTSATAPKSSPSPAAPKSSEAPSALETQKPAGPGDVASPSVVPLLMADGSVVGVPTRGPTPTTEFSRPQGVEIRDGELLLGAKFSLGAVGGQRPLACDQWLDATTDSDGRLLVLDGARRVWRWDLQRGASVRSLLDLPAGRTPADLGLDETHEAGLRRGRPTPGTIGDAFRWSHDEAGVRFEVRVTQPDGQPKWLATRLSGGGADLHRFGAIRALDGSNDLWLELPTPSDESLAGRTLVCPASGAERFSKLRLVNSSSFSPPSPQVAFRAAGLAFAPSVQGWQVSDSQEKLAIPIKAGRLAIDRIRSAAAASDARETRLYLLTDLPGRVARLRWTSEGLEPPVLLPCPRSDREPDELRSRDGRVLLRVAGDWFELEERDSGAAGIAATWRPRNVEWRECLSGASPWRFTGTLTYNGAVMTTVVDAARSLCIGADVAKLDDTPPGRRVRCEARGPFVYQAIDGNWYQAAPNETVSLPWASPPPAEGASRFGTAGMTFPRRPSAAADYQLAGVDKSLSLPLRLSAGRLPHWDVVAIAPRGRNELLLSFGRTDGASSTNDPLCFGTITPDADGWGAIGYSLRRPAESPAPNYAFHDGCALSAETGRRLVWRFVDGKWQLHVTEPTGASIALGWIDERGLAIDQAALVRPVRLNRDEVEFEFDGRVWRKAKGGRLDQIALAADASLRAARLTVDKDGRMTQWTDAPPTLADPTLAAFASDAASGVSKYAPDVSVHAGLQGDGLDAVLELSSRSSHGAAGIALSAKAAGSGGKWRFPLMHPEEIVVEADDLLVLRDEATEALWRLSAPTAKAATPAVLLKVVRGANVCETLRREANKDRVATDAFRLERRSTRRFQIEAKRSDQAEWAEFASTLERGLPGSWPTAVAAVGRDLLVQDSAALYRLASTDGRFVTIRSVAVDSLRLSRHADRLLLASSKTAKPQLVSAGAEGQIELTAAGEGSGRVVAGREWGVDQTLPHASVKVTLVLDDDEVPLHPRDDKRVVAGPLALDVVRLVRSESSDGAALFTSIGAHRVAGGPEAAAGEGRLEVGSSIVRDWLERLTDWRNLHDIDGRRSIGARVAAPGEEPKVLVADDRLSLRPRSEDDCEYQSFDRDGWKLKRESDDARLTLSRPLTIDGRRRNQRLDEDEIFDGGQMSFDHVRKVELDGEGRLVVRTSRTIERLSPGAGGRPELEVVAVSGEPFKASAPPGSVALIRTGDVESAAWSFEFNGSRLQAPPSALVGAKPFAVDSDSNVPRAFQHRGRIWLIDPGGVSWIEGTQRWSGRRQAELRPTPAHEETADRPR